MAGVYGMSKRRRFSERDEIRTLLLQGADIPCGFGCEVLITLKHVSGAERDHGVPVALDGPDTPENCAYHLGPCHAAKTNGKPHTSYGSDKHQIAKANRIAGGGKKRRGPRLRSQPFRTNRSGQFKTGINKPTERRNG